MARLIPIPHVATCRPSAFRTVRARASDPRRAPIHSDDPASAAAVRTRAVGVGSDAGRDGHRAAVGGRPRSLDSTACALGGRIDASRQIPPDPLDGLAGRVDPSSRVLGEDVDRDLLRVSSERLDRLPGGVEPCPGLPDDRLGSDPVSVVSRRALDRLRERLPRLVDGVPESTDRIVPGVDEPMVGTFLNSRSLGVPFVHTVSSTAGRLTLRRASERPLEFYGRSRSGRREPRLAAYRRSIASAPSGSPVDSPTRTPAGGDPRRFQQSIHVHGPTNAPEPRHRLEAGSIPERWSRVNSTDCLIIIALYRH